jgi:hypothetical protein
MFVNSMTMNSGKPPPLGENTDVPAATDSAAAGGTAWPRHDAGAGWRPWQGAIVAALLAAAGAWLLGESRVARAVAADAAIPTMGQIVMAPTVATTQAAEIKNTVRTFGALGALLGLLLGLAGGLSRGNARAAWAAGASGLIAGGVTGAAGPLFVVRAFHHWQSEGADDLIVSMVMHSGLLTLLGAAAGLALAIGLGNKRRFAHAALGGAIGAVVGAVFYDLIGAFAFPLANTAEPLATTAAARFAELIVPAIAIAVGAASGSRK